MKKKRSLLSWILEFAGRKKSYFGGSVVLAILGVGAFVAYKFIKGRDVLNEDSWEKRDFAGCSMTLPSALKESDNIVELNNKYSRLGFFTSENVAVYALEYQLSAEEKKMLQQQNGVETIKKSLIATTKRRTINGQKLDPKQHGELICTEYSANRKNYIKL